MGIGPLTAYSISRIFWLTVNAGGVETIT